MLRILEPHIKLYPFNALATEEITELDIRISDTDFIICDSGNDQSYTKIASNTSIFINCEGNRMQIWNTISTQDLNNAEYRGAFEYKCFDETKTFESMCIFAYMSWALELLKSVKKISISGSNNNIDLLCDVLVSGAEIKISGTNNKLVGRKFKIGDIYCDHIIDEINGERIINY